MADTKTSRKAEIERIPASDARDRLTELMNRACFGGESFILTRNGEDVAAIIGANRLETAA